MIGIDEAGRGPVMGPLVVGIVNLDPGWEPDHAPLKDSKKLSVGRRERLYKEIQSSLQYQIHVIPAWSVSRSSESLPKLEARIIVQALNQMNETRAIGDRLSPGEKIHIWVNNHLDDMDVTFETGADDRYPAVSAASIMAKVTRDRSIDMLSDRWGEIGSGYPSDPTTRTWLKRYHRRNKSAWPPFIRTSWSTVQEIEESENQTELEYEKS